MNIKGKFSNMVLFSVILLMILISIILFRMRLFRIGNCVKLYYILFKLSFLIKIMGDSVIYNINGMVIIGKLKVSVKKVLFL